MTISSERVIQIYKECRSDFNKDLELTKEFREVLLKFTKQIELEIKEAELK